MSRNSRRSKVQHKIPTPQPPTPSAAPPAPAYSNPFGVDLVAATEVVKLPSEGKFYGPESTLHGVSEVEIRHMTAREEDILANQQYMLDGSVFDRVINSVLVDKNINPLDFIAGDRNAILYAARITGYGNEYKVKMPCPKCGAEADFVFDLDKCEQKHELPEGVEFFEDHGLFGFVLPKTGMTVHAKILTAADEQYLQKQNEKTEKLGLENNQTVNLFSRAIASVNGVTDRALLNDLFPKLPALDSRKIRTVLNNISPEVSTKQNVVCGSCGEESESEVPFSLGFFWPDT